MTARRTRAVPTLLVTVGLCAVAGLTGPAVSAGATTTTVAADVDLTAGLTPVEGGDSVDDPTSVTAGRYVDTFPEGDGAFRTYNIERTVPGSVINYGVTVLEPEARASVTSVMLLPDSPASDLVTCGSLVRQDEVRATTMPLTTFGGISLDTPRCVAADSMDIGVIADDGDNPPAPGTPFELVVWETPQPANVEELLGSTFTSGKELVGVAADEVERQVEPGASAARAAVLPEPGGYHVDLPLGRVSWFAVDVPDGSLVAAQAEVHDLERANQGGTLELRVVGPGGGFANPPQLDDGLGDFETVSGSVGTIGLDPLLVQTQSASVGPAGYSVITSPRQARTDNTALTTTAGWYYVVAYAQNLTGEEDATLPVTLTTDVLDADVYALDQPRYAGPEPEALPGPEAVEPTAYDGAAAEAERREAVEAAEAAEEAELAAAGEDQPIPWWFWLVAVLVVVLAAGVAVLLARRTSRARRPAARPGPGGPPGGFGPGGPPGGFGPGGPPGGFGPGGPRPGGFGQGPATPPTVVRPGSPPAGQRPPGQAPTPQGPPPPAAPWQPGDASTRERPER